MKITKYLHSCLLIEEQGKVILLDPGVYTYQEKVFPLNSLKKLDSIGITHEHQDHMDIPFIKEIIAKFPNITIFSNKSVKAILEKEKINVNTTDNDMFSLQDLQHEKLLSTFPPVAPNIGITVFNKLLHVGDSLKFSKLPEILALPIQAPWGSLVEAAERGAVAKPKYIIPIHDYHWKDDARRQFYKWLISFYQPQDITFFPVETGEMIEIN